MVNVENFYIMVEINLTRGTDSTQKFSAKNKILEEKKVKTALFKIP